MEIYEGLFSHGVIQRNHQNISNASFSGECKSTGVLKAYTTCEGSIVQGFYPAAAGRARNGRIEGQLDGLPSGGPYNIRLEIEDCQGQTVESFDLEDVLVGDVWILAGQSNMEGNGYIKDALEPAAAVHACYMDDNWDIAKDPIHFMGAAVDEIHIELCGGIRPESSYVGTGPGVAFAQELHRITGVPQGLISCAHGNTSMCQWNPSLKHLDGKSLYGSMIRRFIKNGGKIAGVLWYQGCNDANPDDVQLYTSRMKELVSSMRKDFEDDNIPVVAVQLSRVASVLPKGKVWNSIQEQQRLLPQLIDNLYVVPSIDLTLDDWIHISGADHKRLGIRCAQAMAALKGCSKGFKPPIELGDITVEKDPISGSINIIVNYDNVIGKLEAAGRPSGFELLEKPDELSFYGIYRIDLNGSSVILKTTINYRDDANNLFLHYGFGVQPYCNISDSAGRSLPVMGPVRVGKPKAFTVVTAAEITQALSCGNAVGSLNYPEFELVFEKIDFNYMFLGVRDRILKAVPNDIYIFYKVNIDCQEKMLLDIFLGYDGPVKMWADKEEILCDPDGTNPSWVDDSKTCFTAEKGEHEILVALSSDKGHSWGIFLRLERLDIPFRLLELGPDFYQMPKLL